MSVTPPLQEADDICASSMKEDDPDNESVTQCYDRTSWTIKFSSLFLLPFASWLLPPLPCLVDCTPPSPPIYYMHYLHHYCTTYTCISTH